MFWYFHGLQKYAIFHTRSRRKEFLVYWGFHLLFLMAAALFDYCIFGCFGGGKLTSLTGLYGIGTFIPTFALTVRRLHDIGRSGMWISVAFIPILGWIYLIYLVLKQSEKRVNDWGVCPRRIRIH